MPLYTKPTPEPTQIFFVYSTLFQNNAVGKMTKDDFDNLEKTLTTNPNAGDIIKGGKGLKKIRFAIHHLGKRSGARGLFLAIQQKSNKRTYYFLTFFLKGDKENISSSELKIYANVVAQIRDKFR